MAIIYRYYIGTGEEAEKLVEVANTNRQARKSAASEVLAIYATLLLNNGFLPRTPLAVQRSNKFIGVAFPDSKPLSESEKKALGLKIGGEMGDGEKYYTVDTRYKVGKDLKEKIKGVNLIPSPSDTITEAIGLTYQVFGLDRQGRTILAWPSAGVHFAFRRIVLKCPHGKDNVQYNLPKWFKEATEAEANDMFQG